MQSDYGLPEEVLLMPQRGQCWKAIASQVLCALLLLGAEPGFADSPAAIDSNALNQAIAERRLKVPEYAEVARMAEQRGLRVFLFGGTAAGLAHYIKWDVLREKGDKSYQSERFDYNYMSIYRSNQDLDIVITRADGKPETEREIEAFQKELHKKFRYFQGNKSQWEVRGLKTEHGTKEVLLGNLNFMNQHTDSNSTGLIELTTPPLKQEPLVRDFRDWKGEPPVFLKDVARGELHFYFSPKHKTTKRFQDGVNPEIEAVIRYFTKAFQYGLKIDPESLKHLAPLIREFNPKKKLHPVVADWIERNGKKLLQNAVDIEYAWNILEETGLRKKLIEIQGDVTDEGSLAWWLSKEPLRSKVGWRQHSFDSSSKQNLWRASPSGKTAGDLGIDVVAHETRGFLAYEAITRSPVGKPNVFISRNETEGEAAVHGDGFYTKAGPKGAASTGFHIRFRVDPAAREGVDFVYDRNTRYVIWRTSKFLTVIPESLEMDPLEAIQYYFSPELEDEEGIREKLGLRLSHEIPRRPEVKQYLLDKMSWTRKGAIDPTVVFKSVLFENDFALLQKASQQLFQECPTKTLAMLLEVAGGSEYVGPLAKKIKTLFGQQLGALLQRGPIVADLPLLEGLGEMIGPSTDENCLDWFGKSQEENALVTLMDQVQLPADKKERDRFTDEVLKKIKIETRQQKANAGLSFLSHPELNPFALPLFLVFNALRDSPVLQLYNTLEVIAPRWFTRAPRDVPLWLRKRLREKIKKTWSEARWQELQLQRKKSLEIYGKQGVPVDDVQYEPLLYSYSFPSYGEPRVPEPLYATAKAIVAYLDTFAPNGSDRGYGVDGNGRRPASAQGDYDKDFFIQLFLSHENGSRLLELIFKQAMLEYVLTDSRDRVSKNATMNFFLKSFFTHELVKKHPKGFEWLELFIEQAKLSAKDIGWLLREIGWMERPELKKRFRGGIAGAAKLSDDLLAQWAFPVSNCLARGVRARN